MARRRSMSTAQRRAMFAHIRENEPIHPHQARVIRRMQKPGALGLVMAHGLGSGKTRTAIEVHRALGGEADVIVPAALKENYLKELRKWGGLEHSTKVKSQQLVALRGKPLTSELLIVDEGHRARNPETSLSEVIRRSAAKKRLILSGTPIYNNPSDIATLVNQAAGKVVLPEGTAFTTRYLRPGPIARFFGRRISHGAELKKNLQKYVDYHPGDPRMLPTVNATVVPVAMGKQQSALYRASVGKIPKNLRLVADNIKRLKPYLTGPREVSNTSNALLPGTNEEPKIDRAFSDLKAHLENPKGKALVYSNWLRYGIEPLHKRLTEAGIPHGVFTGRESPKVRNQAVADYNAGKVRALLASSSGSEGLDLKGTRLVQILEPHFNNAKIRQVIGRSARIGSHAGLRPSERTVESRLYIARPQNRWLPGQSRGVDDLLRDVSQSKDEEAEAIISLLKRRRRAG